ncbi:hypothetical protein [Bacillus horti]|uniref:Uncharacterized protein YacL n=1 Tax=Caldalkalibacillus horti TaxID=77523 RepID=A0ABT9VWU9_9BACI|nr:hypothetical protein [Bacillus horti]MDQ0165471.1 uncharacterized protein YacL [Bacillus horti]
MVIEVICIMFLSYLFYRQGIRQLFKSRLLKDMKADFFAYSFLMITGLLLGTLSSFAVLWLLVEVYHPVLQVVVASLCSIFIGEFLYRRNKYLIKKTLPQSKNSK